MKLELHFIFLRFYLADLENHSKNIDPFIPM